MKKSKDLQDLDDFFNIDDDEDEKFGAFDAPTHNKYGLVEQSLLEELGILEEEDTPEKEPNPDETFDYDELYAEEIEVDQRHVIERDIRIAVSNLITELEKSGANLNKIDIVVRKDGDKYVAKVDNKRDLKLKEIFKDEI